MRRLRFHSPKPIEDQPLVVEEGPTPEPGAGQVRIRIRTCGVCHTDLHIAEGDIHPPHLPVTPGHQVVGVVEELGAGVDAALLGQRVGLPWLYNACGTCEYCQRGEENLCAQARFTGFDVDGGFAEAMIAEANYVLPIPESIGDRDAAPLLCAGIIGYRSLHKADLQPGERLGLFGFGASAHLAIQVARHWNCEVYAFTRSAEHRQHAEDLDAAWVGGAEDHPPAALDRAVIFAPAGPLVPMALGKLRPGGTLAINAIHMSDIPQMPYELIYGERTLRSVANATYQDGVEFLRLAAEIPIQPTTKLYALEEANEALADLKHSRINGEAVLKIGSE
jgi:propanol-preferring alcohol dehydrogenase